VTRLSDLVKGAEFVPKIDVVSKANPVEHPMVTLGEILASMLADPPRDPKDSKRRLQEISRRLKQAQVRLKKLEHADRARKIKLVASMAGELLGDPVGGKVSEFLRRHMTGVPLPSAGRSRG
jgi:hypothetical protein